MGLFSLHERKVIALLAEAVIAPGAALASGGEHTADRLERYLTRMPPWVAQGARPVVWTAEACAIAYTGRPLSLLDVGTTRVLLERVSHSPIAAARHALRGILGLIKLAHFDDPAVFESLGCRYALTKITTETPRWLEKVTDGKAVGTRESLDLEVDVVVVGSGAGGAVVAYELATRGHAVLILEEGSYFRRSDFDGRAGRMAQKMYREGGLTVALGNLSAPVWAGRTVGGTTTINSGTCYRAPERTFRTWREKFGLYMFSRASIDPYYERVESILGVETSATEHLGSIARVIAKGSDRLGYIHKPLRRNAPGCDGQGVCCFGCPTGAKRSTDVSYVPMALQSGAELFSNTRVDKILVHGSRVAGVTAQCDGGGKISVRAQMTVIAGGALMTPVLLLSNRLANRSGRVGKNLSVHPAQKVLALFDERIEMDRGIPQGYAIEHFADDGLMFEGCNTPLDVTAMGIPFIGKKFTELIEHYHHLATFGFMIQDTSRGRVSQGPFGRPAITYWMNKPDVRKMQRGIEILCRVFLAAGAKRVFPSVHGFDQIDSERDLARLCAHRLRASDLEVTAHHPLGTAQMGTDPAASVVGPDHQAHDIQDLYVVDGSAVPTSLGVNPQLTIMAMATRAAEVMDARLFARTRVRTAGGSKTV